MQVPAKKASKKKNNNNNKKGLLIANEQLCRLVEAGA